jgi:hypothetical protein
LEQPTRLHASIGGFFGRCYTIELHESALRYRCWERDSCLADEKLNPTDQEWSGFRQALDSLGVWRWSSNYHARGVTDGTSWSFDISWGHTTISSGGSNAFPPEFESFLGAVSQLLRGRAFE